MDNLSGAVRSRIMARVKGTGNRSTECVFVSILRAESIKGWRRNSTVFGRPDFVFRKARVAVFIDGCFWHGCKKHCRYPKSNAPYWINKIARNKTRDRVVTTQLKKAGWNVLRFWEHDLSGGAVLTRKINKLKFLLQQ